MLNKLKIGFILSLIINVCGCPMKVRREYSKLAGHDVTSAVMADKYYEKGDYEKAALLYNNFVLIRPDDWRGYYNLGQCYINLRRNDDAIESFKQSLALNHKNRSALKILTKLYTKSKKFPEAAGIAKTAFLMEPRDHELFMNLEITYYNINRLNDVPEIANEALKKNPDNSFLYNNLGLFYSKTKKHNEAIECFKKAIKIEPNSETYYSNLGFAYIDIKLYREALECGIKVLQLKPMEKHGHAIIGFAELELNNISIAKSELNYLREHYPNYKDTKTLQDKITNFEKSLARPSKLKTDD